MIDERATLGLEDGAVEPVARCGPGQQTIERAVRVGNIEERTERARRGEGVTGSQAHPRPLARLPPKLPHQRGLAGPRLTANDDDVATVVVRLVKHAVQGAELGRPFQQFHAGTIPHRRRRSLGPPRQLSPITLARPLVEQGCLRFDGRIRGRVRPTTPDDCRCRVACPYPANAL